MIAAGVMVSVGVMVCFIVAYSGIVRTNEAVGTFDVEAGLSLVKHFTAVILFTCARVLEARTTTRRSGNEDFIMVPAVNLQS